MENKFFFNEKNKNIDDIKTDINNKNNHIQAVGQIMAIQI